ncbi:MAG: adenosylmethionine decarboxylase [Candidatus Paceibacterota bacterium]|jgi:spermidine synthase
MKNKSLDDNRIIGTHYIVDLFGCNRKQINSSDFLKKVLMESINGTDIKILNHAFYSFDPQGVTGFFLLSTSHMSFHSWPEHEYISIDIYSCSSEKMTRKIVDYILEKICHREAVVKTVDRTYNLISKKNGNEPIIKMAVYKDGSEQVIHVTKRVENIKSPFQQIEIVDTEEFGRCMIIDNLIQTSEKDHTLYDRAILKGLSKTDKEIIILGGGDGYVAEEALRINPDLKITIVDLDVEVVNVARKYLGQKVFDHPNVKLYIGDALQYLKAVKGNSVDGIVSDLTDNPALEFDNTYAEDYTRFFEQIVPLIKAHLNKDGWLSIQAGTSIVTKSHLDTAKIIERIAKKTFSKVNKEDVLIPSFGEENCFIIAEK